MYYVPYYRNDNLLLAQISKAINGESSAIACYAKLAELAPSEVEKARILEIRLDELEHLQKFTAIYVSLTGTQPTVQISSDCPSEYFAGIDYAFSDEQNTVEFYSQVADQANDPYIKESFRRAATDEQRHAVWFLYYLTKHKSKTSSENSPLTK
ncbi:ferritin-like domain-containing protein [Paenibacillus taichungensis]|uniref:ferritin-like domain-containing protein n=1 Tax=Paenibacillus TaxID=44249 RepID=UPI00096EA0D1|nr:MULTISPECIES: ferritin-like domain-containing protein [Paenibacillus]OME80551.1 rubrerythrin family protein [Paenibacillus pabuli]MDR9743730.1 ferritin-like domain-containing protein [Paenibacillus taichungensis]MEC0106242.1 ferritin-like domain-containing protein [Paenibacillus taichungensis]MEC0200988.1 ferritin-like domain-containing protein [Paenibacillus taichungensis]PIH59213.1 rubrerythrin family protein [Paenibacillus sp. LK1]